MLQDITIINRSGDKRTIESAELPREFPVKLIVNGEELAVLIASPHDLRFLVAGFLFLQGYVDSVSDFELLSFCEDYGIANVRIKGEVKKSAPVLTSGCGGGISFAIPCQPSENEQGSFPKLERTFPADKIYALFDELAKHAERYKRHGGIHSAAIADGEKILLYAEDLGRHNTIDRLAGEALLRGMDLSGTIMITSGRISSEMAAKSARLRVSLIASRTSPTDMAVKICDSAGIALIGYVRAGKFSVYSHPEKIIQSHAGKRISQITGVILAGGASTRMGQDKSLLDAGGKAFIERVYGILSEIFDEVIVVTNNPERYPFLNCKMVKDIYPGKGTLAGIHAGLTAASTEKAFVVGCDMPFLNSALIRRLAYLIQNEDALVPHTPDGPQPLHAIYNKNSIPVIERHLTEGDISVVGVLADLRTTIVLQEEIAEYDRDFRSFYNINTMAEYETLSASEGLAQK